MIERFNEEFGYSLVEVMASIMILTIAILPMVGMFDMGLNAATRGGDYDRARTLANLKLEEAKSLPYESVRTDFPSEASSNKGAPGGTGSITSSLVTRSEDPLVYQGFSYSVTKHYLEELPVTPTSGFFEFVGSNSATDTKLLRVTVTVRWADNTYQTSGLVAA